MNQSGYRGSAVHEENEEDKEATSTSSEWEMEELSESTSEEESENVDGDDDCEETTEEEEESPPYSPLSSPKPTAPTFSPEKTMVTTCKHPPPQLIPISELNSFQTPADPNNKQSLFSTGSQKQPRTRRRGLLVKTHAVDQAKRDQGLGWFCVCSTQFTEKTNLNTHIKNFNQEPKFSCKWCPRKYTHLARLRRHVVETHHENPFMKKSRGCSDCGIIFKTREEHHSHRLANHPQWTEKLKSIPHAVDETVADAGHFRCVCGKEYAKEQYLIIHVRNYNNPANFQCETCLSSFKKLGQLQRHYKNAHKMPAKDNDRFGCTLCARLFQNRKEICQHMHREHHVIFKNHADKLTNPSKRSREHGVAPRTPEEEEDVVFRCLCGSGHPSKFQLLTHIRNSQAQVTFKCPHCQGDFAVHAKLARHIRKVHQVEYDASGCHLCGVIFESKCLLMQHQQRAHGATVGRRKT